MSLALSRLLQQASAGLRGESAVRPLLSTAAGVSSQVVLREDVGGLGAAGEIVSVSAGFARNCLLPGRKAVPATAANKQSAAEEAAAAAARAADVAARQSSKQVEAAREERVVAELGVVVRRLTQAPLVVRVRCDKAGLARDLVTSKQLLREISEKKKVDLPAASLLLPGPLGLGEHTVPLKFDRRYLPGSHYMTVQVKKKL
jgi:large subunit ribosomal protein L9